MAVGEPNGQAQSLESTHARCSKACSEWHRRKWTLWLHQVPLLSMWTDGNEAALLMAELKLEHRVCMRIVSGASIYGLRFIVPSPPQRAWSR
mmetsp:Transcript_53948/g.139380  ORF Transcript_53948/g.139380 Transcript_53948/m.139380 type:complete len:92 (-) Transcript_53948:16-291(-)